MHEQKATLLTNSRKLHKDAEVFIRGLLRPEFLDPPPCSQLFNAYVIIFDPEPAKGVCIMATEIDIDLKKHTKLSHNDNTGVYAVATFRRTSSLARTCRSEMLMPFS